MAVNPAFGQIKRNDNGGKGRIRIVAFSGSVTAICPCEGIPMHVPIIPGQYARIECPNCKTIHRVESITYHEPRQEPAAEGAKLKPVQITINFDSYTPKIIRPPAGLVV